MSIPFYVLPIAVLSQYLFGITLFLLSTFLILLILVQQGRGGGLTGALGGPGGQSAFGTKAGDIFTRVTMVLASIWIVLAAIAVYFFNEPDAGAALSNTTVNTTNISSSDPAAVPSMGGSTTPDAAFPALGLGEANKATQDATTPAASAEVDAATEKPLTFESTTPDAAPATQTPPTSETPAASPATEAPAAETTATETPAAETPAAESPAPQPQP